MSTNREHVTKARDTTQPDNQAATRSLAFEVYRSTTFVVIRDEHGRLVAHLDIDSGDWDALMHHTSQVRRADQAQADTS